MKVDHCACATTLQLFSSALAALDTRRTDACTRIGWDKYAQLLHAA